MTVTFQRGCAGSKDVITSRRACCITSSHDGNDSQRRCQDRSKSSSTVQRGVAIRQGASITRCRHIGSSRVNPAARSVSRSRSGGSASLSTVMIVERRLGSRSMYQENASLFRMWVSDIAGSSCRASCGSPSRWTRRGLGNQGPWSLRGGTRWHGAEDRAHPRAWDLSLTLSRGLHAGSDGSPRRRSAPPCARHRHD